jgi:hypothetical protein
MTLELVLLGENASAVWVWAWEVLHRMQATMAREVARRAEALGARWDRTLVRLFARVSLEVLAECELAVEALVAVWFRAQEGSCSRGRGTLALDIVLDWRITHYVFVEKNKACSD